MKGIWLHRQIRDNLIIFCGGWGVDGIPFQPLSSSSFDVYMLYDYQSLVPPEELQLIVDGYKRITLIGWSMGVWVGQKLFADKSASLHRTLALNGTLCPINDFWGIPQAVFAGTLADYDAAGQMKFYRRMCRDKTNLKMFLANQPQRSYSDQRKELAALEKLVECIPAEQSIYQEIVIAGHDFIIPSANQRNYWANKQKIEIAGYHFLFYLWQSWDDLLAFADSHFVQ